jgi:seryl-tRNA synthetase
MLALRNIPAEQVEMAARALSEKRSLQADLDSKRNTRRLLESTSGRSSTQPPEEIRQRLLEIKAEIQQLEERHKQAAEETERSMLALPNIPDAKSVDTLETTLIRTMGTNRQAHGVSFYEIGKRLGLCDPERATKLSGPGFLVYLDDGARLLKALEILGVDIHRDKYREVYLPELVREIALFGSGHLPKFSTGAYKVEGESLWALPTAEVALLGLHRDERIDSADLPICFVTKAHCFRREIGNAGKAAHWRLHEYCQIELSRLCLPDQAEDNYELLLNDSVKALDMLEVSYRVRKLCPADLPFAASRAHEIQVYSPGTDIWLPVSTASLFETFQARRSNIRFKRKKESDFVVTMNSSALAVSRMWGILLEQGFEKDGRVRVPRVLQDYLGSEYLGNI